MRRKHTEGFTLVELMTVLGVAGMLAIMIASSSVLMKRSLEKDRKVVDLQLRLSNAMAEIMSNLRNAGFGVDPRFTFEVDINNDGTIDADGGANGTDELRFVYREPDPRLYWRVINITCNQAQLFADANTNPVNLRPGSILFVQTQDSSRGTFVRVGGSVLNAVGIVTVPLVGNTNMDYNFCSSTLDGMAVLNVPLPTDSDFNNGSAVAMQVRYFRYYIGKPPAQPVEGLYLDTGEDRDGDGAYGRVDPNDHILIAQGIEDLQVEYTLATHINNLTNLGDLFLNPDQFRIPASGFTDLNNGFPVPDQISVPYTDAQRMLLHPANIRKVYVTLVARSLDEIPAIASVRPAISNHTQPAGSTPGTLQTNDNFYRDWLRSAEVTRNTLSTSLFRLVQMQ